MEEKDEQTLLYNRTNNAAIFKEIAIPEYIVAKYDTNRRSLEVYDADRWREIKARASSRLAMSRAAIKNKGTRESAVPQYAQSCPGKAG